MSEFGAELPIGLHPMDGPSCSNPAVCFALPAGIGDVTNGCFAIVVAALLALKEVDARRATYSWCFFWKRRPRRSDYDGRNDLAGAAHVFALAFQHLCTGIMQKLDAGVGTYR